MKEMPFSLLSLGTKMTFNLFFFDEEDDVLSDTDYELPRAQERMLSVSLFFSFVIFTQ